MPQLVYSTIALLLFAAGPRAHAAVEIAFLKLGHPGPRERANAEFAHVAISYRGQWLHVYPFRTVELIASLDAYDREPVILRAESIPEPLPSLVRGLLGRPFDQDMDWDRHDKLYCSELVGKFLGVPPRPMTFDGPNWAARVVPMRGKPGISPESLFIQLAKDPRFQLQW